MNKRINKKGALTTQQIVLLIILITSFAVILYFFMSADLGGESKKQICHDSVLRSSHKDIPGDTELNCHRTYVCITEDGSCEGMSKPEKKEVGDIEEVYDILAQEMAECWWMFGEGKLDYIGKKATKKNYCSICSQILFDDSLNNLDGVEKGRISKDELYDYMAENKLSSSGEQNEEDKTYTEYMLGTNNLTKFKEQITSHEDYSSEEEPSFGDIRTGFEYYVVMGVTSEVSGVWKVAGAVAITAGTIFTGGTLGVVLVGGGIASIVGGEVAEMVDPEILAIPVEGEGIDNTFMAPTIIRAESEKFEALNCKEQLVYAGN